jgi:hypothetical protein
VAELLAWLAHHQLAACTAAGGSDLIAARILYRRWYSTVGRSGCNCGSVCERCQWRSSAITMIAVLGGLIWPALAVVWLVQVAQPKTITERALIVKAQRVRLLNEQLELERQTRETRAARAAYIDELEIDTGNGRA